MEILPNKSPPINIIFEDKWIVVVEKDAWTPVYPLREDEKWSLMNGLIERFPEADFVHRLDNNTSGLIIAGKNQAVVKKLRTQFEKRTIIKKYIALVLGTPSESGEILAPIIHDPKNKKKMKVAEFGQDAKTSYKLLKSFFGGQYSLLEVEIKTGVRHQIRCHLSSIGHPIAGDTLYQNVRQRKRDKTGLKRQFLHSSFVRFLNPGNNKPMEFCSGLTEELDNLLTRLEKM